MIILAIDPGTRHTGFSIVHYTLNKPPELLFVETLNIDHELDTLKYVNTLHGERFCRILAVCKQFSKLLLAYVPNLIACEQCYYSGIANPFATLTSLICALKLEAYNIDESLEFHMVEPSIVKQYVGVKGNTGDKELMRNAVSKLDMVNLDVNILDEHSIDSIAINVTAYNRC
jgi:Holliday junction resolvasome RuvABC endonuclease subunit